MGFEANGARNSGMVTLRCTSVMLSGYQSAWMHGLCYSVVLSDFSETAPGEPNRHSMNGC